jgi:hypothetical protein
LVGKSPEQSVFVIAAMFTTEMVIVKVGTVNELRIPREICDRSILRAIHTLQIQKNKYKKYIKNKKRKRFDRAFLDITSERQTRQQIFFIGALD